MTTPPNQPSRAAKLAEQITSGRFIPDLTPLLQSFADEERKEAEAQADKAVANAQRAGNALYSAIVARLEPHFPKDTRDLEWDVLPATLARLTSQVRELEESNRGLSSQLADTTLENGKQVKALRLLSNEAKALLARLESYEGHAFYERHQVEIVNLSCAINDVAAHTAGKGAEAKWPYEKVREEEQRQIDNYMNSGDRVLAPASPSPIATGSVKPAEWMENAATELREWKYMPNRETLLDIIARHYAATQSAQGDDGARLDALDAHPSNLQWEDENKPGAWYFDWRAGPGHGYRYGAKTIRQAADCIKTSDDFPARAANEGRTT